MTAFRPCAAIAAAFLWAPLPALGQANETRATGFLTGHAFAGKSKARQNYTLLTHAIPTVDSGSAGGAASFGWMDSGSVVLLAHAKVLPSIYPALAKRAVHTPKPPLDKDQLPRFVMVCAWPIVEGKPGKASAGFAERDDANIDMRREKYSTSLRVNWVSVPAARGQDKFGRSDYCGEIARTSQSTAPLWLPDGER